MVCVDQLADREAPYLRRLEDAGFTVERNRLGRLFTEEELVELLPGAYATIAGGEPYTERVFTAAPSLKVVARFGVGYDKVDVAAATRHGVAVAMAFGTNHESVADGAFALLAAVAGDIVRRDRLVRSGGWGAAFHRGLWRATVGVVGLGRIGRAFVRRCRGFEMQVLGYDPMPDAAYERESGVKLVGLDDLLARSDFVSLHAPLNHDTENMIDAHALSLMKPEAILVNTARGGLVDEEALADALRSGRIAGAGIDVFRRTPPLGSPLLALDNVVLT
ncbi:MAG: phosphoglycerate dehydrogenase, partial [Acetobacteraceae bacterium]|nr:phosphoglycerate dehydrogenase [Acetobacteraceae bacterium]